jgi:hypothetical protein
MMQVTPQTLSSRLKEVNDSYRHSLPREELLQAVDDTVHLSESGRLMGHRLVQAALFRHAGIRVPREQVLEALREHDPAGLAARQEPILPRRTYDVTEAMTLWHVDCRLPQAAPCSSKFLAPCSVFQMYITTSLP